MPFLSENPVLYCSWLDAIVQMPALSTASNTRLLIKIRLILKYFAPAIAPILGTKVLQKVFYASTFVLLFGKSFAFYKTVAVKIRENPSEGKRVVWQGAKI